MPNIQATWQEALGAAVVLAAVWAVLSRRGKLTRAQPAIHELALIIGLYGLWQLAGALAHGSLQAAMARGLWIWNAQRTVGLPSEVSVQRPILPHPLIVQAANLYYYSAHFTVLILFLIWLFIRRRGAYPRWRTTLAILTTTCLVIQFLPVAPPRLVPATGMVDTAVLYHQSVYSSSKGIAADSLSAMPSIHVAWATFVALCLWRMTTAKSVWRYLAIFHLVLTVWVIVVTGNHYWADGIVAVALLAITLLVQECTRRAWTHASPQWQGRLAMFKAQLGPRRPPDAHAVADSGK